MRGDMGGADSSTETNGLLFECIRNLEIRREANAGDEILFSIGRSGKLECHLMQYDPYPEWMWKLYYNGEVVHEDKSHSIGSCIHDAKLRYSKAFSSDSVEMAELYKKHFKHMIHIPENGDDNGNDKGKTE